VITGVELFPYCLEEMVNLFISELNSFSNAYSFTSFKVAFLPLSVIWSLIHHEMYIVYTLQFITLVKIVINISTQRQT